MDNDNRMYTNNKFGESSINYTDLGSIPNISEPVHGKNNMIDYDYPHEDLSKLKELFEKWGLQCVYQTCIDQFIDMKILAYMTSEQVEKLLSKFPWGIIFKFENELKKWQKNINVVNDADNNKTNSVQVLSCPSNSLNVETLGTPKILSFTSNHKIKIDDVLNSTTKGSLILDYYTKHNKLNDGIRSTLVDILIGHIISHKIPMSVSLAESISNQIVGMFKSEVKDIYFMKIGNNKNPKGKLYTKYYNSLRNLKNNGLVSSSTEVRSETSTDPDKLKNTNWPEREFVPEIEIEYILDLLKHNSSYSSYTELESNWKATVNYRLNDIKCSKLTRDILNNWKQYLIPYGHKLIDIDYNALFPNANNIYQDFNLKADNIFKLLKEKVKDSNCRKILENIANNDALIINENVKNAALFYLLHAMFAPTSRKVTRDNDGKKNLVKYSIRDSQDSFMVFGESVEAQQQHLEKLRSEGNPIQPFIVIVGTIYEQREILVYFDSVLYKVHSVLRSVELCYKIFHLFNLEYPLQSFVVWLFIQKYLFNVNLKYDKPVPKLIQILAEINQ